MAPLVPIRWFLGVWLILVTQVSQSAQAEEHGLGVISTQHQIWHVSSRHLSCPGQDEDSPQLLVERMDEQGCWQVAPLGELTEAEGGVTIVYVHGNRIDDRDATRRAMMLYDLVKNDAVGLLRVVVWSWPATRSRGPLRDFRQKARRADVDAEYLAWMLARVKSRVSLVGYSYGVRVVTGALHAVGGQTVIGRTTPTTVPIRAVFVAAGVHHHWLLPGHCHGLAVPRSELIVSLYNTCDPALKRYPWIEKHARPQALGYVGFNSSALGDDSSKVRQINVAARIGRTHDELAYYRNAPTLATIRETILYTD